MTQEILQTQSPKKNTFEKANHEFQANISKLRSSVSTNASSAKIIANIQECPCLAKCVHEIQNTNYSSIDSMYSAKHEYAKIKIIDAIRDKFADHVAVTSEHQTNNGKLDISISPGNNIVLKYKDRVIGIELKSGKWADARMLFQIERYLLDCDILIFVRLPTKEVTLIRREPLLPALTESIITLNRKISTIIEGNRNKVQGDWCNGCNVQCSYKKASKWNGETNKPTLEGFEDFTGNIDTVIPKVLNNLSKELT